MSRAALALILLLLVPTSAAPSGHYSVSLLGTDNPVCSDEVPCATIQHVVDNICPQVCTINLADGTYNQRTSVIYYKLVSISGNCGNPFAVTVTDAGVPGAIFAVQDHAILTIQCMTLSSNTSGSVGFLARQFSIGDVNYVNFVQFPGGNGVAVNETSQVNVFSPGFYGAANLGMSAGDLSTLKVGGSVTVNGPNFGTAFIGSFFGSRIKFYAAVAGFTPSYSYICSDATVENSATIPGALGAYPGNSGCKTYG